MGLGLLSVLLATAVWAWRPIPMERFHGKVEVLTLSQAKALAPLWVDAREVTAYLSGHIPGAISLTETNWNGDFERFAQQWRPGRTVVVYCDGGACQASTAVAERLKTAVPTVNVKILEGGYSVWR